MDVNVSLETINKILVWKRKQSTFNRYNYFWTIAWACGWANDWNEGAGALNEGPDEKLDPEENDWPDENDGESALLPNDELPPNDEPPKDEPLEKELPKELDPENDGAGAIEKWKCIKIGWNYKFKFFDSKNYGLVW